MEEKTKGQQLKETLFYEQKDAFNGLTDEIREEAMKFCVPYAVFLDRAKTEREAVAEGIKMAEARGFVPYTFGQPVKAGDKFYFNNRGKSLHVFVIGSEPLENGIRISAAHVDSPRIDLKQHPVFEDTGVCYLKTHYYGGIKKWQWVTIPLALHGTVCKADGTTVDICIGEDESDPIFYITDILPHLGREQSAKPMGTAIDGESLNIVVGAAPFADEKADQKYKLNFLSALYEKYGITERDLMSAEISAVPAMKARDIGLDRTLMGAYGHDDRVCAYPMLLAALEEENPVHTIYAIFADKEETGSDGPTGMQGSLMTDIFEDLANTMGANIHTVRANSKCLSADVNAAYDPKFAGQFEAKNASYINQGVVITKFTGSGGKGGTNDASAEFVGYIHNLLSDNGVLFQTGELGRVDAGGGGTVAKYISAHNIDTIDIGVPVLSMHAPYEVVSKYDVYETYRCVKVFNNAKN
ncbi:MAG: aminopeptidase [Clostridia bacterium]|nr:aminopeptidase [Clostridia bacterium]